MASASCRMLMATSLSRGYDLYVEAAEGRSLNGECMEVPWAVKDQPALLHKRPTFQLFVIHNYYRVCGTFALGSVSHMLAVRAEKETGLGNRIICPGFHTVCDQDATPPTLCHKNQAFAVR